MGKSKTKSKPKKYKDFKSFLKAKDIKFSAKTYFVDAMGGMAQGLFASLLIGTILSTIGKYLAMVDVEAIGRLAHFITKAGSLASAVTGAAIGVGIAAALKAPMLVMACAAVVGQFANAYPGKPYAAGPLGVFVAVIIAVELGKMVSKEDKGGYPCNSYRYFRLWFPFRIPDLPPDRHRYELARNIH